MTLTEYLKKDGVVLEVDISKLPDGVNIETVVEIMGVFNVIKQDTPAVVIKDTRENRDILKNEYDQPKP